MSAPTASPPVGSKRGTVKVLLLVIAAVMLLIVAPLGTLFVVAVVRAMERDIARASTRSGPTTPLDQSYTSTNGIVTMHYPPDFAAKKLDHATLMLTRQLGGGLDEVVVAAAVHPPVTDDVNEFARLLLYSQKQKITENGGVITETGRAPATCLGMNGLHVDSDYRLKGVDMAVSSCFVIDGDVGFKFETIAPRSLLATETPILQRILDATELRRP